MSRNRFWLLLVLCCSLALLVACGGGGEGEGSGEGDDVPIEVLDGLPVADIVWSEPPGNATVRSANALFDRSTRFCSRSIANRNSSASMMAPRCRRALSATSADGRTTDFINGRVRAAGSTWMGGTA